MNLIRATLFAFITLTVAACQPTGVRSLSGATQATFGSIEPRVPEGWKRHIRPNGVIVYQCAQLDCVNRGQIAFSSMYWSNDAEQATRTMLKQGSSLRDVAELLYKASNGGLEQISFTDMSTNNRAVYERVYRVNLINSTYYYIMRVSVEGQSSKIISASAPTLPQARHYLKIALAAVKQ